MKDSAPRSIGVPMLIVVFVSICLFSFSGIAYSTARSSLQRSGEQSERVKAYYAACNEAEEFLASLQEVPDTETTYSFPFGTAMEELQVSVAPDPEGEGFMVTGWVISDTASWEAPTEGGSGGVQGPQGPQGPDGPQGPTQ